MIDLEKLRKAVESGYGADGELDIKVAISSLKRLERMYRKIGFKYPSIYFVNNSPPPVDVEDKVNWINKRMEEYVCFLNDHKSIEWAALMRPMFCDHIIDLIVGNIWMRCYFRHIKRVEKIIQKNHIRIHIWRMKREYDLDLSNKK